MSVDLDERVRRVEDFQAITNLQAKYSFLTDSYEIDEAVTLFSKEFIWETGFEKMTTVTSKEDLVNLLKKAETGTPMTIHQPTTPYIEVDGDNATGRWYLIGMLTSATKQGKFAKWIQGQYNNAYIRENSEWKIKHLNFKFNFLTPYEDGWAKTPIARF